MTEAVTLEMAEAALDLWKTVPATLSERDNRRRRVLGMQRDIAAFEDRVRRLAADAAPELAAQSVEAIVDQLHARAMAANATYQHRESLKEARVF